MMKLVVEDRRLHSENNNLKRMIFGQKRERFVPEQNEHQLSFLSSENPFQAAVQYEKIPSYTRRKKAKNKKHPVRQAIPAHIPRKEIVIEPEQDTAGLKKIGKEITEELEYISGLNTHYPGMTVSLSGPYRAGRSKKVLQDRDCRPM